MESTKEKEKSNETREKSQNAYQTLVVFTVRANFSVPNIEHSNTCLHASVYMQCK